MPETSTDFDSLWDYDKPAETEMKFRELLPAIHNPSHHVQLLTQIARAEGLQRKFDAAHQTLDNAEKFLTPDLKRARIRYLLERGRAFNSSGQPDKAQPLFQQAYELAQAEREDFYAVDAAHMLAIVEPPEQQLAWNRRHLSHQSDGRHPRTHPRQFPDCGQSRRGSGDSHLTQYAASLRS
jgi:tetratricopeptide (TPR) repeat protein